MLAIPRRLGPFVLALRAGSLHQLWLPDGSSRAAPSRHVLATAAAVDLPLERRFGRVRHRITPAIRYRLNPWTSGTSPAWIHDGLERLTVGHGVEAALGTSLGRFRQPALMVLEVTERFDLPGFDRAPGAAYLLASGTFGPSWLNLRGDVALDHRRPRPSQVYAALASSDGRGNTIETGAGWYGPGRGPQLDGRWSSSTGPWLAAPWPVQPDESLALFERATAWFTRHWGANAGARVGLYPRPGLQLLWYGLELRSGCGCIAVGLNASHRPASWIPDVLATFRLIDY
jgi:hypothetical protein